MRSRSFGPVLALLFVGACTSHVDPGTDATLGDASDASSQPDVNSPDTATPDAARDAAPPPPAHAAATPLIQWADPRVGTGGEGFGVGSSYPGPQRPFGMARPGPDTTDATGFAIEFQHCAGYFDSDTHIAGFSQTHMHGTGIVDYGHLGVMPVLGDAASAFAPGGHRAPFHRDTEQMHPAYYAVTVDVGAAAPQPVRVEITTSPRVALYRMTFPAGATAPSVLLDLGHHLPSVSVTSGELTVDRTAGELSGSVRISGGYSGGIGGVQLYFVGRASAGVANASVWTGSASTTPVDHATGTTIGAMLPVQNGTVTLALGMSYVDVAHARANLVAEASDLDFDRVRHEGEAAWESMLGRVHLEGRVDSDFSQFYTALYHTLLMPSLQSDTDGAYRGVDMQVHQAAGFAYYSDFSLWDTYRTEHPWLTLLYPEYQRDMVRSMLAMGDALGYFPRWPLATGETGGMIGDPGGLMVADTYLRGLTDFDAEHAYSIARVSALDPSRAGRRENLQSYLTNGFVPLEVEGRTASETLEFANSDGAVGNLARALGHADDAALLTAHAGNWHNLFDPSTGFMVGRHTDGTFATLDSTTTWQPFYAEGNAWHYAWFAPHQLAALSQANGGDAAMIDRLDRFFRTSQRTARGVAPEPYYWQGNEPDIHAPWIFSALGDAVHTAHWVHWVRSTRYGTGADGLPGNDDAGTMSAWYLFASLGFYPLAGTDDVLLGAPLFTRATLAPDATHTLVIEAPEADGTGLVPSELQLGTTVVSRPLVSYAALRAAGRLGFTLRAE